MSLGHPGVITLVVADIFAGFAVLASWAQFLNPVLTMLVSLCALAYYMRSYIAPFCSWLNKRGKDDEGEHS